MTALNRKLLGVLKQLNTGKYAGSVLSLLLEIFTFTMFL